MKYFSRTLVTLLTAVLPRRAVSPDRARRDSILQILLICASGALLLVFSLLFIAQVFGLVDGYELISSLIPFGLFLLCCMLFGLTQRGYGLWASWIFLSLSLLFPAFISYTYGASIPQSLLTFALVIVMAGVLISSKTSFFITLALIGFITTLMYLQELGVVQANTAWRTYQPNVGNSIAYNLCLLLISVVSWLFNRHSERALEQARVFESALLQERDQLEETVYQRTQELRQMQAHRFQELQKFAEFGRQATGFFHDLANPLNVISLSLEEVNQRRITNKKAFKNMHMAIRDAISATHKIEEYIASTRSVLQNQEIKKPFSLLKELKMAIRMLEPRAKRQHVHLELNAPETTLQLTGNNIKLHQVITNLIANALDAYELNTDKKAKRLITLQLKQTEVGIEVSVEDQAGGIKPTISPHIFDPFFSTKDSSDHLGIGLATCKTIIEQDFGGTIKHQHFGKAGTRFVLSFSENVV